jgi:hypothetical protein
VDGRDIEPSRAALLRALGEATGTSASGDVQDVVPDGAVVLIDTYEALTALDTWLRETVLPRWPSRAVIVLAGRHTPGVAWTTDIAWSRLGRIVPLGNFEPAESRAFLRAHAVASATQAKVLEFTRGHPLALALVSDVLARRKDLRDFDPVQAPDVIRHLSGLFLETVTEARHREALDVSALARVTSEPLLVALLGEEAGRDGFAWLRRQSFVASGAHGVFPHDLVREVVLADARWRDAAALGRLARRVYAALHAQIRGAAGPERLRLQMDALYVTRTRPTNAAFFDWSALDDARVEPAEAGDETFILDLVARHEGPQSADLAEEWWRVQPSAFQVFRGPDDAPFGFAALLDVGEPAPSDPADPAIGAARAFVQRHGPVRRGEGVVYLRWWMHREAYQAVTAAINLAAMHTVSQCVTRPGIAWNFVAMADPSFWRAHFDGVNFPRVEDADFQVGGRRYGVFAHDWRVEPPADWMMGNRIPMPFAPTADPRPSVRPMTEAEFQDAVRQALRDYTRPDALAEGPLRSSRLLRDTPEAKARASALQALLREAVAALDANPRDRKLHRALWHTYLEPLATQELAAERLGLPFSTYRHHLSRGIERVTRWLWQRERASS